MRAVLLRMLQDVGVALSKAESEERAIRIVERIVCRSGPWQVGHAYRVTELDGRTVLVPSGSWFSKDKRRFDTHRLAQLSRSVWAGKGLVGHVYSSGKPTYVRDLGMLSAGVRPAVADIGFRAALVLPTASAESVNAVLEFYSTEPVDFPGDWLSAAGSIAAQLGGLIARKELERIVADHDLKERRAISRDLHDSISQQVTALGLMVGRLQRRMKRDAPQEAAEVDEIVQVVTDLKKQVRAFIDDLGPLEATSADLASNLQQLAERTTAMHDIDCHFRGDGRHSELEPTVAQQLLYVAREAVHNAVKHSGGGRVTLSLRDLPHRIVLGIRDDGRGFGYGRKEPAGRGMTIMRYRAGLIGAHLNVASRPGHGTVVRCVIPKRASE
jgi:signal transduction histidine kinase